MKLKITGKTKERFDQNLERFLNMATMICLAGTVPTKNDIDKTETHGGWWYLEEQNNRYQLVGSTNNNWLNIKEKNDLSIIVEFNFRYDKDYQKKQSIESTMIAFLDFVEPISTT